MPKTGVVKRPFPYSGDGVNLEHLKEGAVLSFPETIYDGLFREGYIGESSGEPENSVGQAAERELAMDGDLDQRLMNASDQQLKDIIARSGTPLSGNLVHAGMVAQAKAQILRERAGAEPVSVDPNSGVTEQPLAKPGEATPPSAKGAIKEIQNEPQDRDAKHADAPAKKNQLGDELPERAKARTTDAPGKHGKK